MTQTIISSNFHPDRLVKTPGGVVLFDSENRQLGIWESDSVNIKSSFGSYGSDLFDPVDLVSSQLDVFVLDQSFHKISQFDAELNFIQDIPLDYTAIYPSQMAIDSRRNIYIYSPETYEIFHSQGLSGELKVFLDLNGETSGNPCGTDMALNQRDELALLMSCNKMVNIYARSGRLIRRFSIPMDDAIRILPLNRSWLIINQKGEMQVLDGNMIKLPMVGQSVKDVIVVDGMVWVLGGTALMIYDVVAEH